MVFSSGGNSSVIDVLQTLQPCARVQVHLNSDSPIDAQFYLYDDSRQCIVVYANEYAGLATDLRLIKIDAIRRIITGTAEQTTKPTKEVGSKSTPSKKGTPIKALGRGSEASTPACRDSRPKTPTVPAEVELTEEGKSLLRGLAKHLAICARGTSIVVTISSGEVTIEPPYTKVTGEGEEIAKVRRILESERGVLPKKTKKKDIKVPVKGG